MPPSLWPTLRRQQSKALSPTSVTAPVAYGGDVERKVVLGAYYEALHSAGVSYGDRSRAWSVEQAVAQGYERVMWVFKAVNRIAGDSARLPYVVREDEDEVEDHPLTRLLNDGKANPLETGRQFRKRLSAQVLLSKRGAFVEVTSSRGGTPVRLDLLPPGRTEIIPGTGDTLIDHYRVTRRNGAIVELDPANVRWFRDPHPLDPYSGTTPLEALGLTIELDYFARLYNANFMRNDGRPGGVLAVKGTGDEATGDIDPAIMDRIEERFGKGPLEAGKLSVIQGDLTYQDLSGKPRDIAYEGISQIAREELLAGFGLSESVLGRAEGKTFDNAAQELYAYWTITQDEHSGLITTGFDEDSDDNLTGHLDTSGVEVLQRLRDQELARAREEVAAGVRSIWSYANLAGYEDEMEETPYTRALFVASGKTPIPTREEDAAALGMAPPADQAPGSPGGEGSPPGEPGGEPQGADGDPGVGGAVGGQVEGGRTPAEAAAAATAATGAGAGGTSPAARAVAAAREAATGTEGKAALWLVPDLPPRARPRARSTRSTQRKAAAAADDEERVSDPDQAALEALEGEVAAALDAATVRWVERAAARLQSPRARKGTRHWAPQYAVDTRVGTKALDAPRAVDEDGWADEAAAVTAALLAAGATEAAAALARDLAPDVDPPDLSGPARAAVTAATTMLRESAAAQAAALAALVNRLDQDGRPLESIVEAVRDRRAVLGRWARNIAATVVNATVGGARTGAAQVLTDADLIDVVRQWVSRRDERVRDAHEDADGQRRGATEPFTVGGVLLRYPSDPLGPPEQVRNCRCWLRFRSRSTGRYAPRPQGLLASSLA